MKNKEVPQLSSIIITLANINDKLRDLSAILEKINENVSNEKTERTNTFKHFVIIKENGIATQRKGKSQD